MFTILLTNYISFKVGYDDTPLYFIDDSNWSRIVFSEEDSDEIKINSTIYFLEFLLTTKLFYLMGYNEYPDEFKLLEIIDEFRKNLHKITSIDNAYDNTSYWWRYYFAPTRISYEIVERLTLYDENSIPDVFINEIHTRFGEEWNLFLDKINELHSF